MLDYLCIALTNWPLQRLLVDEPRLWRSASPAAVAVFASDDRRGQTIVACCRRARAAGIRAGMLLSEATALAHRAGKLTALPHDPAADLAALAQLAEHCQRFSPLVGWETFCGNELPPQRTSPPSALLLDVRGIARLFGGDDSLLREVHTSIGQLGYRPTIALAPTIAAAWAMAHAQMLSSELLSSSTTLQLFTSLDQLHSLPVCTLRFPPDLLETLASLGIETIGHLASLPRDSVASRLGPTPIVRLDQLLGHAAETIRSHRPPPRFVAEQVLDFPTHRGEQIELWLQTLLDELASQLSHHREGATQIICRLDCGAEQSAPRPLMWQLGLSRPSAEPDHLWQLMRLQVEQLRLPGSVGRIRIEASLTSPLEVRQAELFATPLSHSVREASQLIDRLTNRLGSDAVLRPQSRLDPLPEQAIRYTPIAAPRVAGEKPKPTSKRSRKTKSDSLHSSDTESVARQSAARQPAAVLRRPTLLLEKPAALAVHSIAPDGPPLVFRWKNHTHHIACFAGPERIESGWWKGPSKRRDYYRIETNHGQRFWIFRDIATGQWFLHGLFG